MNLTLFKFLGLITACLAFFAASNAPKEDNTNTWRILIGGDTRGYLSPCGCVKPMSGGVRRRLTAIKAAQAQGQTLTLELGGLTAKANRQAEIKLETLAEILRIGSVDAIGLAPEDLKINPGILGSVHRLSGEKLIATNPTTLGNQILPQYADKGPFIIGSISDTKSPQARNQIQELTQLATQLDQAPILIIGTGEAEARRIAIAHPSLKVIAYRYTGNPTEPVKYQGNTALVTPGDKGRHVVELIWNERVTSGTLLKLDPEIKNDSDAQRIYTQYLQRVKQEKLLEQLPRTEITKYTGSKACQSCHPSEYKIWQESQHGAALKTLEDDMHDRDPECVGCHVVGLDSIKGFKSRAETPDLADVGCESCHGSGVSHSAKPMEVKMPKVGRNSCMPCHNLDHSPTFDFLTYWEKIKH